MVLDPEAEDTDAFAAADNNFWHDVRDTGTFIWDTKSFIDVVPESNLGMKNKFFL